jgi:hypothetical protein
MRELMNKQQLTRVIERDSYVLTNRSIRNGIVIIHYFNKEGKYIRVIDNLDNTYEVMKGEIK